MMTTLRVAQQGVDLVVEVQQDELGRFEVDSPTGRQGDEVVVLAAPESSRVFTVDLRSFGGVFDENASYVLDLAVQRPLSPSDALYFEAEVLFHRARVLQEALPRRFDPWADQTFERAALAFKQLDLADRQAQALFLQGQLRDQGSRYTEAAESYASSLAIREHADGRVQLGNALALTGRWQQAEASFKLALDLYGYEEGSAVATAWQSLGNLYRRQGHFGEATRSLQRAHAILARTGPTHKRLATLNSLGELKLNQGAPQEALAYFQRSFNEAPEGAEVRLETLYLLGVTQMQTGDLDLAKDLFAQVLERFEEHPTRLGIHALIGQGLIAQQLGDPERAARIYRQALERSSAMGVPLDTAIVQNNLAWLQLELGRPIEARELFEEALASVSTLGETALEGGLRHGLGQVAIQLGETVTAENELELALRSVERVRSQTSRQDRMVVMASRHHIFETYVHWLMERHAEEPHLGRDRQAFAVADQSKARALLDLLTAGEADLRHPAVDPQSRDRVLRNVQAHLDDSSRLLSYHLSESESFLWIVGPDRLDSMALGPASEIETRIQRLHRQMENRHQPGGRERIQRALDALAKQILPSADLIAGAQRLVIVPSGELFRAPFGALPWPVSSESVDDFRLLDQVELVFLPSSSVLMVRRGRSEISASDGLVALADPIYGIEDNRLSRRPVRRSDDDVFSRLHGTAEEVRRVATALGEHPSRLLLGAEANLQQVLDGALDEARWIHLATHGVPHESSPELSFLLLSQLTEDGAWQDGHLTARRLAALDLEAELVVLSACHSGPGRPIRGEGLTGLARSALIAGARQVVVSLWAVDDMAAPTLMEHFYGFLAEGMPAAEALRQAQQRVRRESRWQDPYYWSGIVLFGDWL